MIVPIPDPVVRRAIRFNAGRRLARERRGGRERRDAFLAELRRSPVAEQVEKPNEQHYELPVELFRLALGHRLKYSCCYWPEGVRTLDEAEDAMLALTCERGQVEDGMTILDLGCGWGSLTFWLAERYPGAQILSVSNSRTQQAFVREQAAARGLRNVEGLLADANTFDTRRRFDRVMSVEMLEHARNYEVLLGRIASWLEPDGKAFVHVFSHREHAYPYEGGWIARNFFTGGTMPSHDLLPSLARELSLEEDWQVDGSHYARTAEAWLHELDAGREEALAILGKAYGPENARRRLRMWRVFFMACAELWGYRGGGEWMVSHYRFSARD